MKTYNPRLGNSTDFFINEPVAQYYSSKTTQMPAYFEKNMMFTDVLKNKIALVSMIQAGLPYMLFNKIVDLAPFSEQEWADYLNLSSKSLQRYKADGNHLFKPIHSEKIIEIAEVTLSGLSVFNDSKKFSHWLHSDCYALGGHKPVFLLSNSYGKEIVLDELNRIEHGIFAQSMLVFRLTKQKYSKELSGVGASFSNNRWNSKGFEVVYCSENRALAMTEVLIHLPLNLIPEDFVMLEINIPETLKIENLDVNELPEYWNKMPYHIQTQTLGNQFIREGKIGVLKVPSAIVKGNFNYLLNPHHADFKKIIIVKSESFPMDERFFH